MVKFEYLSDNLVKILTEIINQQELVKYLNYDVKNPLSQADLTLPAKSLMSSKVFPFPFDPKVVLEDSSQIRVYYPDGEFEKGEIVQDIIVYFDIVVAKSLWLTNDGKPAIRPYEMMKHLIGLFKDSKGTVGRLVFHSFSHLNVNEKFDAIRVVAEMTLIGTE